MLKKLIGYSAVLFLALLATDIAMSFVYPGVSALKKENPQKTAFMEYREKQWAKEGIHKAVIQKWVPLKRISPYLIKAVIIAEDDKFWGHEGFDFVAMQQALEKDIKKRQFKAGGSTISQQLAKNLYLSSEKSLIRKLREYFLAVRLEEELPKNRIFHLYLNVIEFGPGIFGVEAAARHYFGKSVGQLNLEEIVRLTAVIPKPLVESPTRNSRWLKWRAGWLLSTLRKTGHISSDQYQQFIGRFK